MNLDLNSWAVPQLKRLLPIDDGSLKEIITYSNSLSKELSVEHLKDLLGDSPQALEFISAFNSHRPDTPGTKSTQPCERTEPAQFPITHESSPGPRRRQNKKPNPPLHNAGPIRRPENYGEVTGAYTKSSMGEDYMPKVPRPAPTMLSNASSPSLSQEPADLLQGPNQPHHHVGSSTIHSQEGNPASLPKLPPSASGVLISDLPNVKSKPSKKPAPNSGSATPRKATSTSSINDLTSAIAALELSTNPSLSSERRKCHCHASIHPLFETAPNCLSCGKIICALEGLQPCSFCNSAILSREQVQTMIRALKDERGQEKMAANNAATSHSGRGTPMLGSGAATPDSSGDEASQAAARARAHRDKLLGFQRENAQRTRVHDEAADYDMTVTPGTMQWMTPVQRAAALKKQQKYLRELEEANKPDWEKKIVMSLSIRNGKLVRGHEVVKSATTTDADADEDVPGGEEGEDASLSQISGGLSRNPLLAGGGLIRPVWKAPDDQKEKVPARESTERRETWRRVQADTDDNEQWILDGGVYGFRDDILDESG